MTTIIITSGTSQTSPADWNNANNKIEGIGAGGGGAFGSSGYGGGGGEYRRSNNFSVATPGVTTFNYVIGAGGAGATTAVDAGAGGNTTFNVNTVIATGGGGATQAGAHGAGGSGGTGANGNNNGGNGGDGVSDGGGGGGGAGGPNGVGQAGGSSSGVTTGGGGGGGGTGTSGTVGGTGGSAAGSAGGAGGQGGAGTGSGAAGAAGGGAGGAATAASGGGGGGGGAGTVAANGGAGGVGATGTEFDSTHGPGGGGGGGGSGATGGATGGQGGNGALYGGGGGAGANSGSALPGAGGNGANGIIFITYTPAGTTATFHDQLMPSFALPRRNLSKFAAALFGGDQGNELPMPPWFNPAGFIHPQPPQPPSKPAVKAAAMFATGDRWTPQPPSQLPPWVNTGEEIAPFQPPHLRPESRAGAIMRGDDGTEFPLIKWFNSGWEIQPFQPGHPRPEKAGSIMVGDPGNEAVFVPPVTTIPAGWEIQFVHLKVYPSINQRYLGSKGKSQFAIFPNFLPTGFEIQPFQPPHPRPEKAGAIMAGDPGNEAVFVPPPTVPFGYEAPFAVIPPRRLRFDVPGDDGIRASFISWTNAGWSVQEAQLPHPRLEQSGALARGDDGIETPFVFWTNSGWSVQNVDPPHPRPERSGAFMPIFNVEAVFVPPVTVPSSGWEIASPPIPQLRMLQRIIAASGDNQFAAFNMGPWWDWVPSHQPQHPRPERAGAIARGDDGIENVFQFTAPTVVLAGYEAVWPQPPHPRPERFGALIGGDLGIESPLVKWSNAGWEITPPQPPHPRPEREGSLVGGDPGFEAPSIIWRNTGWEIAPHQPPHPRPERSGSIMIGDPGIENTYVFVPLFLVSWGFEPPPTNYRIRVERSGALARGEDGAEGPFSAWALYGWQVPEIAVRAPLARRGAFLDGLKDALTVTVAPPSTPTWGFDQQPIVFRRPARQVDLGGGTDVVWPILKVSWGFEPTFPWFGGRRNVTLDGAIRIDSPYVFVPLPPLSGFVTIPEVTLRKVVNPAGAILPSDANWFIRVFPPVFYATSKITQASAIVTVTSMIGQTVIKGETSGQ